MRTFQEFMSLCEEVEDKSKALGFAATIRRSQEGGRIRPERKKSTPEIRRVRAVGGGRTEPVHAKILVLNVVLKLDNSNQNKNVDLQEKDN